MHAFGAITIYGAAWSEEAMQVLPFMLYHHDNCIQSDILCSKPGTCHWHCPAAQISSFYTSSKSNILLNIHGQAETKTQRQEKVKQQDDYGDED